MAYSLRQLSDLEEIKVVKHRYFRGIDTADTALLDTLFTDDIKVEYRGGNYRVELAGKADMLVFLANSFHSGTMAMHHGHMPEITFTGEDSADGVWYLEDIFINFEWETHTFGSALYRDRYRRIDGVWKIAHTAYERIMEVVLPIDPKAKFTTHHLAKAGLGPDQREDITRLIRWDD